MKKEVIYHIIFWAVYLLLWTVRDLVNFPDFFYRSLKINTWQMLIIAPFVYINLYVLVPRFLFKSRYTIYLLSLSMIVIVLTPLASIYNSVVFINVYEFYDTASYYASAQGILVLFTEIILVLFITMAFFFFKEWYMKDYRLKVVEKEKMESELQMLKQQIQPHFLFNTLNTIYMLMEKNTVDAKRTLIQFSDILSHQLYETQNDYIQLDKELSYIRNYCEIENQRHEDSLALTLEIDTDYGNYLIAPMLLIPFVENAFKHGKLADKYWVVFQLKVTDCKLRLIVENSCAPEVVDKLAGGIGLKNVQKRLSLIYPNHELLINKDINKYRIELDLELMDEKTHKN